MLGQKFADFLLQLKENLVIIDNMSYFLNEIFVHFELLYVENL